MDNLGPILSVLQSMGLMLAVVFYVAIVIWVYKDSRKRTDDPIFVATFTAIGMLPIVGVFVYMLVRPSEYIADMRERELEIRMMERELGRQERCPYCKSHIEPNYLSCPVCTTKLRHLCTGCDQPLDPRWVLCPLCETEVPGRTRPSDGPSRRSQAKPAPAAEVSPRTAATPASRERSQGSSRDDSARRARRSETARASTAAKSSSGSKPASKSAAKPAAKPGKASKPASSSASDITEIRTEPIGPDSTNRD